MFKINRLFLCFLLTTATVAFAHESGHRHFRANLLGYCGSSEVPAVLTRGSGQVTNVSDQRELHAELRPDGVRPNDPVHE